MAPKGGSRKAARNSPVCPDERRLARNLIHRLGELDVALGQAAGVVGRQGDVNGLIDVEPFGMVIEFFRNQRRTGHEAEGLVEIGKNEFPGDGVAPRSLAPAFEPGQGSFARFTREFYSCASSVCTGELCRSSLSQLWAKICR